VKLKPLLRRWRQFLANRGVPATLSALVRGVARRWLPTVFGQAPASELWRNADAAPIVVHPFDARYGTETGGLIWGEELPTGHRHDVWNTAYYGIAPSAFVEALRLLSERAALDLSAFTFIDLGSGKGRAVLLAAQYPFARVVGVELAPQLYEVAVANLARFPANERRAGIVEFKLADAAEFPWGESLAGPLLLFLYNPFSRPVLEKFLARLHASLLDRPVYVLYVNPELDAVLARQPWIEKLWEDTIFIGEADQLADRFGSITESVAAYRCSM